MTFPALRRLMTFPALLVIHAAACWYMTGLIWFVQVVHYPLFGLVGPEFPPYARAHQDRTSRVVFPPMLIELTSAAGLVWLGGPTWRLAMALNLGGVLLIWASTALLQIPRHHELSRKFSAPSHIQLVRSNWMRTALWSIRSVGLAAGVLQLLR